MKKRVGGIDSFSTATRSLFLCPQKRASSRDKMLETVNCFTSCCGCRRSDSSGAPNPRRGKSVRLPEKASDKNADDTVCLLRESPFRILRVAESGNVKEFHRLLTNDISKLNMRDSRGRAPAHQATIRNHVPILQVVLTFHGDLNVTDNQGNTPLHLAVEAEALDVLEFLLSNGADTTILNERSSAPLHMASELNKTNALKMLAKYRHLLEVNQGGEHGRTALHIAATYDHEECMKILLYEIGACPRRKCKHGFFPIHEAAKHASSRSMEILLTWGEDNSCPREEMISFFDAEGNVPLHSAVHGGDIKAVELCIKSGAKISMQQHDLSTPVHLACAQGSMEIVKLMFTLQPEEKDTCLKSCDMQRMTPLHCAAMFDHHKLVEYLISQGASVNVLDKERRSPLHLSAIRNGWRTMCVLMSHGANITLKDNDQRNLLHAIVIHGGELDKILDNEDVDFLSILEERDKNGYTALHYAAKLGHIKTAERLLKLGTSITTKNNDGENVFHIACRYGRLNIINEILKTEMYNTVTNEGDGTGATPLHIASSEGSNPNLGLVFHILADRGHARVVQALLKKGAILHRDHKGRTPLHIAASNGYRDTMRLILNVHSHLLNQVDKDGNTALHLAAMENQPDAVDYLLKMNCALVYNSKGFSAIDFALDNKWSAVALVMVVHKTRGDEVLAMASGKYPSVMLGLVALMPHVASAVLDRCIHKSNGNTDSELYQIKYDFKWLSFIEQTEDEKLYSEEKGHTLEEQAEERKHLPILNGMVSYGRVELLSHELSRKYIQMKWHAYGKYINLAQLILYILYLALLTFYASKIVDVNEKYERNVTYDYFDGTERLAWWRPNPSAYNDTVEAKLNPLTRLAKNLIKGSYEKKQNIFMKLIAIVILCVATFNLLRECSNLYRQNLKYAMDSVNWIFWAMNISCVCMVAKSYELGVVSEESNANTSAAIAIFLGWLYLLLFLQRFDVVGIYVAMFLEILHTLIRVLMVFSILIVAFGLAFYILLSTGDHVAFSDIPHSLMRTFSMMLGDLDYFNTFVNPYFCIGHERGQRQTGRWAAMCSRDERTLPYPFASFAILGVFIVFVPILLMNLLIGLAVGDIESVRRNAQLKRLAMQVQLHTALEKTLPKFILLRVDKKEVIEYPNASKVRLGMVDYLFKNFLSKSRPRGPGHGSRERAITAEEELTDDLKLAIQDSNYSMANLANQLESIEGLVRMLCHKMELNTDADFLDEGTQIDDGNLMSDIKTRLRRAVTAKRTRRIKRFSQKRSESSLV